MVVRVVPGAPASFTLQAVDPNGDPLTFTLLGGPSHGRLEGEPPQLTYTPEPGFVGTDEIRFAASDPCGAFDLGTVRLEVSSEIPTYRIGGPDRPADTVLASLAADLAHRGVQTWYIFGEQHSTVIGQTIAVLLPPGGELQWVGMYPARSGEMESVPIRASWNPQGWLRVPTDSCVPGTYILTVVKDRQAFSFLIYLARDPVFRLTAQEAGESQGGL